MNETVEDIVAEMRQKIVKGSYIDRPWAKCLADRIEAAMRRERSKMTSLLTDQIKINNDLVYDYSKLTDENYNLRNELSMLR